MGFQVVEIPALDALVREPRMADAATQLLGWLAGEVILAGMVPAGVRLAVVCVEYLGASPALGIDYGSEAVEDQASHVVQLAEAKLRSPTMLGELLLFARGGRISWDEVRDRGAVSAEELLERAGASG